jgi:hypothetical protein
MKCTSQASTRSYLVKLSFLMCLVISAMLLSGGAFAQGITLSGVIKDVSGVAIPGASVKIRNSKAGVNTDSLGRFSMPIKNGSVLDISAIGFNDTTITVEGGNTLTVIMQVRQNNLQDVAVNAPGNAATTTDPIAFDQIMASALSNYALSSGFSNGVSQVSGASGKGQYYHVITTGFGSQNTINNGVMLPYYMPKGETRGSKYLFPGYVAGVVVDSGNGLVQNAAPEYNYDKMGGILLLRKDAGNYIEVDKLLVKGFVLKDNDTTYVFMRVPAISASQYYILVGAGQKYSVVKLLKTKFIKSNYVSNGLTESGNNYDEYVDEYEYYLVNAKDKRVEPAKFNLKKKAIKEAFGADGQKAETFFTEHKKDDINDAFLKGMVEFVN